MTKTNLLQSGAGLMVLAGWGMQFSDGSHSRLVMALTILGLGMAVGGHVWTGTLARPAKLIGLIASAAIVFAGVMQLRASSLSSVSTPSSFTGILVLLVAAFLLLSPNGRPVQSA